MRNVAWACVAVALLASVAAAEPTTQPAPAAPVLLYEDPNGVSAASVQQVLPTGAGLNPSTNSTTYMAVTSIAITQDVFIIRWQNGATTILPRQYVVSITVNRKVSRASAEAATPGTEKPR